jgi:hypothetical protein
MAKFELLNVDALGKESVNLPKTLANNDTRVQRYLVSEIAFIEANRDPRRLNKFFAALETAKSGARVSAMHAFIQAFANVTYDGKKNGYVMKPERSKSAGETAVNAAMSTSWTTYKPEPTPRQFDAPGTAKAFLERMFREGISFEEVEKVLEDVKFEALRETKEKLEKVRKAAEQAVKATENLAKLEHVAASIETPEEVETSNLQDVGQ